MGIELDILNAIHGLSGPVMDRVMQAVAVVTSHGAVWVLLSCILMCDRRLRPAGVAMLLCMLGGDGPVRRDHETGDMQGEACGLRALPAPGGTSLQLFVPLGSQHGGLLRRNRSVHVPQEAGAADHVPCGLRRILEAVPIRPLADGCRRRDPPRDHRVGGDGVPAEKVCTALLR